MFWAVPIVLAVFWALAVGSQYAFGGAVHVLLVAAILMVAYRLFQSRRKRPVH